MKQYIVSCEPIYFVILCHIVSIFDSVVKIKKRYGSAFPES